MKQVIFQFSKFAIVGGTAAVINYLTIIFFVEIVLFSYILAKIPAFFLAVIFNYMANSKFTFKKTAKCRKQFLRYLIVLFFGFFLSLIFAKMATVLFFDSEIVFFIVFGQSIKFYMIVEVFLTGVFMFYNFIGHKFFTFR